MSNFKAEIVVPTSKIRDLLIKEGYLHCGFSNAELYDIDFERLVVANDCTIYSNLKLIFETNSIN